MFTMASSTLVDSCESNLIGRMLTGGGGSDRAPELQPEPEGDVRRAAQHSEPERRESGSFAEPSPAVRSSDPVGSAGRPAANPPLPAPAGPTHSYTPTPPRGLSHAPTPPLGSGPRPSSVPRPDSAPPAPRSSPRLTLRVSRARPAASMALLGRLSFAPGRGPRRVRRLWRGVSGAASTLLLPASGARGVWARAAVLRVVPLAVVCQLGHRGPRARGPETGRGRAGRAGLIRGPFL